MQMGASNELCSQYDVKMSNQSLDILNVWTTQRLQYGAKINQMQWEAIINFASKYKFKFRLILVYNPHL